ncbi:hypothetical protein BDN72DRAFT_834629 [Pluteus cervinus]|uniref:Uncharacterized protein n=1 Tax=Pluteus cervinus TaxID=181527 RepID=A0ACD3B777_9AGAR|nr:hypothetical protein BDN72DRAFT_834629 [Pluteus cervinus]
MLLVKPADEHNPREPSKLFFESENVRRIILFAYWAVIIAATPLWWYTTSIERLSLPTSRVRSQAGNQLKITVPIHLHTGDSELAGGLRKELLQITAEDAEHWNGITVHVDHGLSDPTNGSYIVKFGGEDPSIDSRTVTFPLDEKAKSAPELKQVASTLAELISPRSQQGDPHHRVAQFSPRYRLAFTLMDEDASAGPAVLEWDFKTAFRRHLLPTLNALSQLHNFTVESQVQYHGRLAFNPVQVDEQSYALTSEQLTVFVNSAEWTLSSSASNDPVLHFLLFVPSATRRPLYIEQDGQISNSNAFILPQWGGILIYNSETNHHINLNSTDLDPIFSTFTNQLHMLLGIPQLPADLRSTQVRSRVITEWQLDALQRRRALENAKGAADTLRSIVNLVEQIENMPVGQDVKGDIQNALSALGQMYTASSLAEIFRHSARAFTLSSRAFFNPGMLAMLYFPAEHKYAVYAPLFASAFLPLVLVAIREFKAWKASRRPVKKVDTTKKIGS